MGKFSGSGRPFRFVGDIEKVLNINHKDSIFLTANYSVIDDGPAIRRDPLSRGSLQDSYDLAVALHSEYLSRRDYNSLHKGTFILPKRPTKESQIKKFNQLSLEYKLANFYQMLQFAYHLEEIGLFYTNRRVAFTELEKLTNKEGRQLGRMRHDTWVYWKDQMGWK